jgi:hypothetical protein
MWIALEIRIPSFPSCAVSLSVREGMQVRAGAEADHIHHLAISCSIADVRIRGCA